MIARSSDMLASRRTRGLDPETAAPPLDPGRAFVASRMTKCPFRTDSFF
jgi:hypothetical protein